jgi:PAS domain S-box-containing protein
MTFEGIDLSGLPLTTVAWLSALTLVGGTALAAIFLLLRDLGRLDAHAHELEAEIEKLHDRVFELADSEERLRSLVEARGDIIVRRDERGRIVFANESFARLVGAARDTLPGQEYRLEVKNRQFLRVYDNGAREIDEAIESAGELRWISWVETSVATPDGVDVQRVGRDVTDRIASERALQDERARAEAASQAKSRFLATVSHEIRTPLNGVIGMADLLADTSLSPEQATYVHALKTSGEALLALIDGILDFSKIEAGKLELVAAPFRIRSLVDAVVELLAPRAQGKGIEIAASIAADVPELVIGDEDRLRQVLMNLAGNAVKFTAEGGVGIRVARAANGRIACQVADTGPGIPEDALALIFREFEQADATASRRHEGTGLGLTISGRIVERMGGSIAVDSAVGRGSSFSFTLALPDAGERADVSILPNLAGRRVMIVAQSPFEAPFLAERLTEAGASVTHFSTAAEAAAALHEIPPHILIADCALGDETARGLAVTARLAGTARTLVLLSPFERREFGSPAKAGFDGYLVKPVRTASLFARLQPSSTAAPTDAEERGVLRHEEAPQPRIHVLLAEDNEVNALLARKVLERLGATADWARNGAEALALATAALRGERRHYDAVLMDVRMPEMDGLAVTRRIREFEAMGGFVPLSIIALTANAFPEDREAARHAGADAFLPKPFDRDALRQLLFPQTPAARVG